jgi:hypothetical protein
MHMNRPVNPCALMSATLFLLLAGLPAAADLLLGPEELVQASGADIEVPGWSVPSFAHWNGDGLKDLVVGEGGVAVDGKVRVYLNVGEPGAPQFSDFFYAQSEGADLTVPGAG